MSDPIGAATSHQQCQKKPHLSRAGEGCLAFGYDQALSSSMFKTSPEIIRLAAMLYIRFPLSLRNVEDLLHERGVDVSHETVRYWWHRFGPKLASEIRKRRIEGMRSSQWR